VVGELKERARETIGKPWNTSQIAMEEVSEHTSTRIGRLWLRHLVLTSLGGKANKQLTSNRSEQAGVVESEVQSENKPRVRHSEAEKADQCTSTNMEILM